MRAVVKIDGAQRRDHDEDADGDAAPLGPGGGDQVGGDAGAAGRLEAQAEQEGDVDQEIDHRDRQGPQDQGARDIVTAVLDFRGDVRGLMPAGVSPEHEDHRRGEPAGADRLAGLGGESCRVAEGEADADDRRQAEDFQHRQEVLGVGAEGHAQDIDCGEEHDGAQREGQLAVAAQVPDLAGVGGEDVGEHADAARTDDGELGPGEQKADQRTEGARQVDVFAARARIGAGQLGEAHRPG
jgi:hypothetical protein